MNWVYMLSLRKPSTGSGEHSYKLTTFQEALLGSVGRWLKQQNNPIYAIKKKDKVVEWELENNIETLDSVCDFS